jgi:amino acid transporter
MSFVLAEMKNPSRDIPRAIHTALPLVIGRCPFDFLTIGLFFTANIAYYANLPMDVLTSSETIAMVSSDIASHLFRISVTLRWEYWEASFTRSAFRLLVLESTTLSPLQPLD